MLQRGDHVCAGVSGGADSVCLFLVLEALRRKKGFSMSVVHVEHGLRGEESILDQEFVRALAQARGIPFAAYRYPVAQMAQEQGLSLEEAGRNARREAYAKEAAKYGERTKIALAHHADDNAETLLFHLCRGSGIEGVAGIAPVRENMIRPLLCVSRRDIEEFLKAEGQEYRTDATNREIDFSRNRIRNRVMPELLAINRQSARHMNQFAEDAREISAYLQGETARILEQNLKKTKDGEICFSIEAFASCPPVLQSRVMLELLAKASGKRKDLSREHANALMELAGGRTGSSLSLPYGIVAENIYGELRLHVSDGRGKDRVCREILLKEPDGCVNLGAGKMRWRVFTIPKKYVKIPKYLYTKWFDYDKIKNGLSFRTRKTGDYFALDSDGHRQKLKDYWINEKVPRQKRDQVWLLADGSHILWAVGYRVSEYYKVTEQTTKVLEARYTEEET